MTEPDGAEYDLEIEVHRYVLEFARAQGTPIYFPQ